MIARLLLLLVGTILCASACSPILYTPPVQNVPLPAQKGDGSLSGSIGLRGLNLQYAGAVSGDYLVLANFRHDKYQRESASFSNVQESTLEHRQTSGELGLGAYGRFGEKSRGAWSMVGGYGLGRTKETPGSGKAFVRSFARYQRAFVQPAVGYAAPRFEAALSLQAAWIGVGPITSGSAEVNGRKLSALTCEPALTLSAGKTVRFYAQGAVTLGNRDYAVAAGQDTWLEFSGDYSLSVGLKIQFGESGNLMWFGREGK